MRLSKRIALSVCGFGFLWITLTAVYDYLNPGLRISDEDREDARWISTSKWWLDRQACRYIGLCGLAHWRPDPADRSRHARRPRPGQEDSDVTISHAMKTAHDQRVYAEELPKWQDFTEGGRRMSPEDWYGDERVLRDTPQYVLDNAPLVHLYSKEEFWPADPSEHLEHMEAYVNYTSLGKQTNMSHVHELNEGYRGMDVYLKSLDNVEDRPAWLHSPYGRPLPYDTKDDAGADVPADTDDSTRAEVRKRRSVRAKKQSGGYSKAPAVLIMVDKGHGIIDAFWFFFYSYNLGPSVLNIRFGNHVGDWEHTLIRFHHGVPKAVFFSAHQGGTSFAFDALEKGRGPGREGRPVVYSAVGSHAMYAMPGKHPYVLPLGLLADRTDKGPLWDPALHHYAYFMNLSVTHDVDSSSSRAGLMYMYETPQTNTRSTNLDARVRKDRFQPAAENADAPTGWFWFNGHWGDKFYTLGDWRQWRFARQYHYNNGPIGPRFKNLGRNNVCGNSGTCKMLSSIEEGKNANWLGTRALGDGLSNIVRGEKASDDW